MIELQLLAGLNALERATGLGQHLGERVSSGSVLGVYG
jgi:hypothetical protein